MIKASKYLLPAALAVMALSGCGNDGNEPETGVSQDFPAFTATIGGAETRAFDQVWEQDDEIGISGCNRSNVCHHTENGDGSFKVKKNGEQIYFQNDEEADFTAYYPWKSLAAGSAAVNVDTKDQSNQKSFDFLWAKASGKKDAPKVAFRFDHKMVKLSLTVKPGSGMSYDELKATRMSLKGIGHTGSFNTADGTTAVSGAGDVWTFTDFGRLNDADKTLTFSLIFLPQAFGSPLEFSAQLDLPGNNGLSLSAGIDFTGANRGKDGAAAKNEWVAGRQYNLSVTLNKTDITLDECVINPWTEVNGEDISVD